jgi:Zn-dependent peptidase ImmA (M78 family)/DNA-binding XRE family transcriptional regulator
MASVDSVTMGERIAAARGRAGLTQAELAAQISLDRSALTKVEKGARRVSALELARIAEVLGERIEWLVMEPPPAVLVAHRNTQEPGAASPGIDRLVERIVWNIEFLAKRDNRFEIQDVEPLARPTNAAEVESTASQARSLLGLDAVEPVHGLAECVLRIGLLTFSFDLGEDAADAASVLLARGGVAVVNGARQVGRRRLAIAHELGHYLFADEYALDWRVCHADDANLWENRLDRFARAVLLPQQGLRDAWAELADSGDDLRTTAVKLASRFRVDMSTLARRAVELGIVQTEDSQRIRSWRTNRADIVEHNLVVSDESQAPDLAEPYVLSVLRLYRSETVSAARALDLLFDTWEENDLPVLPTLPESAVWTFVS